jgi:outer membrane lipoprotein SlyB
MRRLLALLFLLMLAACADTGTRGVNTGQPPEPPRLGTVQSVSPVDLPNEGGSAGAAIGGTAGAVAGANTGGGRGTYANTILGGVLGSIAGDAMQNSGTHPGVEIWVKLDDGKTEVIRQSLNKNDVFHVGDRINLIKDKHGMHVEHLPMDGIRH